MFLRQPQAVSSLLASMGLFGLSAWQRTPSAGCCQRKVQGMTKASIPVWLFVLHCLFAERALNAFNFSWAVFLQRHSTVGGSKAGK